MRYRRLRLETYKRFIASTHEPACNRVRRTIVESNKSTMEGVVLRYNPEGTEN